MFASGDILLRTDTYAVSQNTVLCSFDLNGDLRYFITVCYVFRTFCGFLNVFRIIT